ncbi:diadenylate cyclase [Thermotomaculum hydrothermale]|uniref:Diadenylate cyclase n=1 Tax=Thermotomaculum hydrothermale TaxID=981385 RepID=A0A7R6PM45_9BACT|nr:diadenylate cyclase CdaA [Thermotomaculum hydrothermale]BBB32632.1 diadenylate cyclase [Thermotomaculum hydrothermale]
MEILNIEAIRIPTITDIIDIVILAYIIYKLLVLIKGTRAMQMIAGIALLFFASFLSGVFHLNTLKTVIDSTISFLPIAVIVLFQYEIRKILARMGTYSFIKNHESIEEHIIEQILKAANMLSKEKKGGLIVIERGQGLGQYIETGITIDAKISFDLIINIFEPKTALHDGAIIISKGRIAAASCLLPLSSNPHLPPHFGTRHRAGIGITEETDAIAIIISEETGKISFAKNGTIMHYKDKSFEGMKNHLIGLLEMENKKGSKKNLLGKIKEAFKK